MLDDFNRNLRKLKRHVFFLHLHEFGNLCPPSMGDDIFPDYSLYIYIYIYIYRENTPLFEQMGELFPFTPNS